MWYARIHPNDATHFCQRYTIGGKLFEVGRWYTLTSDAAADVLREQKNDKGTDIFQVFDEAGWRREAQRDAARLLEQFGGAALAMAGTFQPPSPSPEPGAAPMVDQNEGLFDDVTTTTPPVARAPVPIPPAPPSKPQPRARR